MTQNSANLPDCAKKMIALQRSFNREFNFSGSYSLLFCIGMRFRWKEADFFQLAVVLIFDSRYSITLSKSI
jgi:hypothetical protein